MIFRGKSYISKDIFVRDLPSQARFFNRIFVFSIVCWLKSSESSIMYCQLIFLYISIKVGRLEKTTNILLNNLDYHKHPVQVSIKVFRLNIYTSYIPVIPTYIPSFYCHPGSSLMHQAALAFRSSTRCFMPTLYRGDLITYLHFQFSS